MSFVISNWEMFNALRNNKHLARFKRDTSVSKLNIDTSSEDQKEVVRILMACAIRPSLSV